MRRWIAFYGGDGAAASSVWDEDVISVDDVERDSGGF